MTGCHPSDANGFDDNELCRISALTSHEKCLAVGEIGLDYYWKPFDKEKQKEVFIKQIELANQSKLPICIHSRDATLDTLTILKENKSKLSNGLVFHCFSGSVETAREVLDLGSYISFAGPLTFKNSRYTVEVAKFAPEDRCLTETDSPYLAPHPLRGTVNSPKNVSIIAAFLASVKGMEVERLAEQVFKNAKTLFKKL
jgi:TatD DNase family protein